MTTDRVAGGALALLALVVIEECWRGRLPFGTLAVPGPAYVPILLATVLFASGILIVAFGRAARAARRRRAGASGATRVAIVAACAFVAWPSSASATGCTIVLALRLPARRRRAPPPGGGRAGRDRPGPGTFYLFDTLLRVPLPRGPFGL